MKVKLLMTGILGLISAAAFAQKGELNNANEKYQKYTVERLSKLTKPQAIADITDAKASIDKASVNEKTANLPLTYALKGAIYSSLAVQDTIPATSLANFKIADEALTKAKSLDSAKNENKDMIHTAYLNLAQYKFDEGRAEFANKKFDLAYQSFDYYRKAYPDTTAYYVTGLSAANQGTIDPKYNALAIASYKQLLTMNYSRNPDIAMDLSSIYLSNKDTTDAFKVISDAVTKYPSNNDLRKREIEIGLQTGKQDQLTVTVDAAIAADPKNKVLYYYDGLTYAQISDSYAAQMRKTKDAAAKANLEKKKLDNCAKAAAQYKKALAIDPNYFEANLYLGYVMLTPAIDEYNDANNLPTNQQKQYEAAVAKAKADFAAALPYVQKAVDLNPKSVDALTSLKTYYLGMQDTANANKVQKQIEALPAAK